MLKGEGITKSYYDRAKRQYVNILQSCSLEIGTGESVGLMGSSGSGKSTLARILLRLVNCDSGTVSFCGEDITCLPQRKLGSFRRQVQFIAQRPESFFDPLWTLERSLREPLTVLGVPFNENKMADILELVKLSRQLLNRYPHQVSGGEIQRLSIARALLLEPKLLVLDEPTSMLDISVQAQILQLLKQIRQEQKLSYLLISHDKRVVDWLCDRRLVLKNGKLDD